MYELGKRVSRWTRYCRSNGLDPPRPHARRLRTEYDIMLAHMAHACRRCRRRTRSPLRVCAACQRNNSRLRYMASTRDSLEFTRRSTALYLKWAEDGRQAEATLQGRVQDMEAEVYALWRSRLQDMRVLP